MIDVFIPKTIELLGDTGDQELPPETDALLTASITIGLNKITKDNVKLWMKRIRMLRRCHIETDVVDGKPWWPTEKLVRAHIGLIIDRPDTELTDDEFNTFVIGLIEEESGDVH